MATIDEPCPALTPACEEALEVWGLIGEWRVESIAPACEYAGVTRFDGLVDRLIMIRGLLDELRSRRVESAR